MGPEQQPCRWFGLSESFERNSLALDRIEARLLDGVHPDTQPPFELERWLATHPSEIGNGLRLSLRSWALATRYPSDWRSLKRARSWYHYPGYGLRRVAEIALEEGELLALRLPQPAQILLDIAFDWFVDAVDYPSATIAAILGTLSTIDRGDFARARQRIDGPVRANYRSLEQFGLPAWSDVVDLARTPDRRLVAAGDWAGWLQRLVCCIAWTSDQASGDRVQAFLSQAYGGSLPPELDGRDGSRGMRSSLRPIERPPSEVVPKDDQNSPLPELGLADPPEDATLPLPADDSRVDEVGVETAAAVPAENEGPARPVGSVAALPAADASTARSDRRAWHVSLAVGGLALSLVFVLILVATRPQAASALGVTRLELFCALSLYSRRCWR